MLKPQPALGNEGQNSGLISEELAVLQAAFDEILSVLVHDFSSPARGMAGCLQLLEGELGTLEGPAGEFLEHAMSSSKRMIDLVSALSRYNNETTTWGEVETVSMDQVLEQALKNLESEISAGAATVVSDTKLGPVLGYATLLSDVLHHLLVNALKFQPLNQQAVITVGRSSEGHFFVKDNGIGIEEKFHSQIFTLFNRLQPDQFAGSGIGLAVCSRILSRHNGKIWVESELGQGATFFFSLAD